MAFALRYNWTLSKYTVIDSDSGENDSILPIAAMAALKVAKSLEITAVLQNPPMEMAAVLQNPPTEIAAVLQNPPTKIAAVLQNPPTEIAAVLQNPPTEIVAVTQASGSHLRCQLWYPWPSAHAKDAHNRSNKQLNYQATEQLKN